MQVNLVAQLAAGCNVHTYLEHMKQAVRTRKAMVVTNVQLSESMACSWLNWLLRRHMRPLPTTAAWGFRWLMPGQMQPSRSQGEAQEACNTQPSWQSNLHAVVSCATMT